MNPDSERLRISLVQASSVPDKEETIKKIEKYSQQASQQKSNLIVFPEIFMFYSPPEESKDIRSVKAEYLHGEYVEKVRNIARKNNIYIITGVYEKVKGKSKIFNTVIIVNGEGNLIGVYRKTHLYDAFNFKESDIYLSSDNKLSLFKIGSFKVGIMVCYEIRFPEIARTLALKGADAIIVPSAWVRGYNKEDQWITLVRARAIENTLYVLTANQIGNVFTGITAVSDPMGNLIMRASEEEEMITTDISKERIKNVRKLVPVLKQRKPELYKL